MKEYFLSLPLKNPNIWYRPKSEIWIYKSVLFLRLWPEVWKAPSALSFRWTQQNGNCETKNKSGLGMSPGGRCPYWACARPRAPSPAVKLPPNAKTKLNLNQKHSRATEIVNLKTLIFIILNYVPVCGSVPCECGGPLRSESSAPPAAGVTGGVSHRCGRWNLSPRPVHPLNILWTTELSPAQTLPSL